MAFEPTPCVGCGGGGGASTDVEQNLLCDTLADGTIVGTALAVYEYDESGNPTGPPIFVIPGTNTPYVVQGTLMTCPGETGCLDPVQFCFTATTTEPVEHQGRTFDAVMPLNPGFPLESITIDGVTTPQNLVWDVADPTGQAFADDLVAALTLLFPDANSITVTPPGSQDCGNPAGQFVIHVGCLRLDQDPPDTLRFTYNGGEDLVQNPAYNETPPLNPPVSQGNYGFHLLARQDDPGPFPGFPPAGRADCTNSPNRGWETNDSGRTFEIWGQDVAGGVTPTPRGTPVQEVNSDGNPGEGGTTIWQTFQVVAGGNFTIRLVHGGRDPGETHTIRLSTGDTNFGGSGDLINNVTTPAAVYGNPWTVFNQVVALAPGVYTLSFKSDNPSGNQARGGLFTDMRAFVDVPGLFSDSIRTDNGCTVSVTETSNTTTCEYWSPICNNGDIESWKNAETGETLTNASFWGQVPSPECCTGTASEGGGTVTPGNLVHNYEVCGVVGGIPQTLQRVVYTNQSGGVVAGAFIGPDGGPVTPTSWFVGSCPATFVARDTELVELCDRQPNGVVTSFVRRMLFSETGALISAANIDADGNPYAPTGTVTMCSVAGNVVDQVLCDTFNIGPTPFRVSFIRKYIQSASGEVISTVDITINGDPYVVQGLVGDCAQSETSGESQILCDSNGTQFLRVYRINADENVFGATDYTLDGAPFNPVGAVGLCGDTAVSDTRDPEILLLCDANGTRFLRKYTYDGETGAFVGITSTTLDGNTAFAPVGAVGVCTQTVATDLDFAEEILCDANNVQFIRRFTFNSTTGAVTATANLTLAGLAYVPVGAVGLCSACCPAVIGEGCVSTGSGRYVAIRNTDGSVSLFDAVTGAAVAAVNIITCPGSTLTAQARLVGDADAAWTPGADVVGTLTSVTFTVLTGTATLTDQSGTVLAALPVGYTATWSVGDDGTLQGPLSIDAIGGNTVVHWTVRP